MEDTTQTRVLGRSGIPVSALGFGCWAVGGEWFAADGRPLGWGPVDDDESVRAIRRAIDLGVTLFDTADVYGTGHSEEVLGRAVAGRRDEVLIASKWGNVFDPATRTSSGTFDVTPEHARRALTDTLRRLGTDRLDLYQFHVNQGPLDAAAELREVCEEFVAEGLIRAYGWSTDDPERARLFAAGPHCATVQVSCNVLADAPEMLTLCAELNLGAVIRGPLAMGALTGKYGPGGTATLGAGDIRARPPEWLTFFENGRVTAAWQARFDAVRSILTSGGRTPAQGALAWLWARSPHTVPIPGIRTVAQAEENAGALAFGPLTEAQMREIEALLAS
ncbi:aldo/keto reductase [Streptomyces radicis]|uniref:Aldo/keto reductase n=1 Tax=Streptomyces radicis TaxID=1750517 RepID=A0A3A9WFY7_9ACTN|nr:aldo/keto reductase [Streptomyces radicis]RKN12151.1 aldo/keto reductase [Streptomyces radicis]RKN25796.1 aldo/keto reductase [Streptomyces radicis]